MKYFSVLLTLTVFLCMGIVSSPFSAEAQPRGLERERQVPPGHDRQDGIPPGLEREGKIPPGFDRGRKTGWEQEYPPGWQQKSEQERQTWRERVKSGREDISRTAREKGLSEDEAQWAADAYERRVRRGMDPEESESAVRERIRRGERGLDLTESVDDDVEQFFRSREEQEEAPGRRPGREDRRGDRERGR